MLRLIALAILLTAVGAVSVENVDPAEAESKTTVVDNIDDYLRENPEVKVLDELTKNTNETRIVSYTLGRRQSGDEVVFAEKISHLLQFMPRNLTTPFNYPSSGDGSMVTYVQINVSQDTDKGRAVVIGGGLDQRLIKILVEAKEVYYLELKAQIFGRY